MTFEEVVDQAIAMLQRRRRVTYSLLKRQFTLDDGALEDLVEEMVYGQQLATDEAGRVLVWKGNTASESAVSDLPPSVTSTVVARQHREPLAYTPVHLAEKILTTRSVLEGERKQVTVLFCDLANSTSIAATIGPEHMQPF